MIAVKFYSDGNATGAPATMPESVHIGVDRMPDGFDQLFTEAGYKEYMHGHEAEFATWKAAQPKPEPLPVEPEPPTLEARLAALEAKQKLIEPDVATLKTDVEALKATR